MKEIKIFSASKNSYLLIKINNLDQIAWKSDFGVSIIINDNGYSGNNNGVGLNFDRYQIFLSELRSCDTKRAGKAILSAVSPDEFEMVIENYDSSGHFTLRYDLC